MEIRPPRHWLRNHRESRFSHRCLPIYKQLSGVQTGEGIQQKAAEARMALRAPTVAALQQTVHTRRISRDLYQSFTAKRRHGFQTGDWQLELPIHVRPSPGQFQAHALHDPGRNAGLHAAGGLLASFGDEASGPNSTETTAVMSVTATRARLKPVTAPCDKNRDTSPAVLNPSRAEANTAAGGSLLVANIACDKIAYVANDRPFL
jgi:hypothetical protein